MAAQISAPVVSPNATPPSAAVCLLQAKINLDAWATAIGLLTQTTTVSVADLTVFVTGLATIFESGIRDGNNILTGATGVARRIALEQAGNPE